MNRGTTGLTQAYGELVAGVGATTKQAEINAATQQFSLDQAWASREAVSGVNLDEEAAELVRFQQAYQAAAQVVAAADQMFQALLGAVRR
jgi:flagellar hook-associated protein 1 FlgK